MKPIFFFLALTWAFIGFNQKTINTENEVTKLGKSKSKLWYLEGEVDGKVLYNSAKLIFYVFGIYTQSWMHVYNKKAELITEWKLPKSAISKLGYRYKGHQFNDNAQGYFVVKKKKKKSKLQPLFFLQGDLNGQVKGSPIKIGNTYKMGNPSVHIDKIGENGISILSETFKSSDKTISFTISSIREGAKKPTYNGRFNIKWEPNYADIQFYSKDDTTHFLVVRNYEWIDIKDKKNKKKRLITRLYTITGKSISQVDLDIEDDLAVSDLSIAKDNANKIKILGHLSRLSKNSFSGLIFGEVDPESKTIIDQNQLKFEPSLIEKLNKTSGKTKKGKNKDQDLEPKKVKNRNYRLIDSYATADEGGVVVSQQKWIRVITTVDGNGNMRTTYYYYYGDIAIMKLNKAGELEWNKIIKSFQVYINYDPGNPYTSLRRGDEIYLIYTGSQKALKIFDKDEEAKLTKKQMAADAIFCLQIDPNSEKVNIGKIYDYASNKRYVPGVNNAGIVENTLCIPMTKKTGWLNILAKRMLKIKFL
ncbi:MAG: hypothetical protein R2799_01785 [Crocinitomicaceae bacterium]